MGLRMATSGREAPNTHEAETDTKRSLAFALLS